MPDASIDVTADALARRLLQDVPARPPVVREAFDALPSAIAGLLRSQFDARLEAETALPDTAWVDAGDERVRDARAAWHDAVAATARVPADTWEAMLTRATRLAVGHLVQPAATLSSYAFADALADPLPTPLVLDRLRAFEAYPYLIEIVERYIDKKGLGHIDRDGLERLLLRIDSRMVAEFSADDWSTLLTPLFDLLGGEAPASLLERAFEARGHRQLVADLSGAAVTREALRAHLTAELAASAPVERATPEPATAPSESVEMVDETPEPIVETAPVTRPSASHAFEVAPRQPEAPEPEAPEPEAPEPTPAVPDAAAEVPAAPAPPVIGSKFNAPEDTAPDDSNVLGPARPVEIVAPMEPRSPEPVSPSHASSPSITDAVVTETMEEHTSSSDEPLWKRLATPSEPSATLAPPSSGSAPLWAQFSQDSTDAVASPTSSAAAPSPPTSVLRTEAPLEALELAVLGGSDADRRAWYTAELFSGDAAAYRNTLVQLDAARTWTEATDIIARDVFRTHSVNIYSDPAVTFTDAVEGAMETR